MIPVEQRKIGGPDEAPENRGDCYAACVASILELALHAVPNVPDTDEEETSRVWESFLEGHGLYRVEIEAEREGWAFRPPGYSIGRAVMPGARPGALEAGYDHAVVCLHGEAVFDPSSHATRNDPAAYTIVSYEILVRRDPVCRSPLPPYSPCKKTCVERG